MNQEQTNITTGKQIRHLRTQLGMTQEELAGELNVTRQALSNWERDVNEPDLNMSYNKKVHWLPPMQELVLGADTLEGVLLLRLAGGVLPYTRTRAQQS